MTSKLTKFWRNRWLNLALALILSLSAIMVLHSATLAAGVDLYWVGDSGNWTDANHWSIASGGAGGHVAPTNVDNAFFDGNSFTSDGQIVTVNDTAVAADLDFSAIDDSATVAIGNKTLTAYGNITLSALLTVTSGTTGILGVLGSANQTLTTNSASLATYIGARGGYTGNLTLLDSLATTGNIIVNGGTFGTGGNSVTAASLAVGTAFTGTINLATSDITVGTWENNAVGAHTINAGTSNITVTGATFAGASKTYYDVNLNAAAVTITGNNTFNILATPSGTAQTITFTDGTIQTVAAGSLLSGSAGNIHTLQGSGVAGWAISSGILSSITDTTDLWQAHEVEVVGSYAYMVNNSENGSKASFAIVDVTDTRNPVILGTIADNTTLRNARELKVDGSYAYVVNTHYAAAGLPSFAVVDISNPLAPFIAANITDDAVLLTSHSVDVSGNYAYTVSWAMPDGRPHFNVIDITNPLAPSVVASITDAVNLAKCHSIHIDGDYAYVAIYDDGVAGYAQFTIVNISNPLAPVVAGSIVDPMLHQARTVDVSGNYAYLSMASTNATTYQFAVIDVSDKTNPTVLAGLTDTNDLEDAHFVQVVGSYAYVSPHTTTAGHSRFTVVDVSDSANPYVIAVYPTDTLNSTVNFDIVGDIAYVVSDLNSRFSVVPVGDLTASYTSISRSTATGGVVFTATQSINGGNNDGWVFPLTISTGAESGIAMTAAGITSGNITGEITDMGGSATVSAWFDYGLTTAYGSTTENVTWATGNYTGVKNQAIPVGLTPGGTYHYRYAVTSSGTTEYGADGSFTLTMPTVTTVSSSVVGTSITLQGNVSSAGVASSSYVRFQYGTTPSLGSITAVQTQAGTGAFTATVPAPSSDTTLYYRSVVTNGAVSAYGATRTLSSPSGTGNMILKSLLRVVLAAVILIGVAKFGGSNPTGLLLSATIGLIAFVIIDTMLINLL